MTRPRHRPLLRASARRRALGSLLLVGPLLVLATAAGSRFLPAADAAGSLGGYQLSARAHAARILYDLPGSLPIGPLVESATVDSAARLATGPRGSAYSSVGYPGPVVLGGEALLAQGGAQFPFDIPDYPVLAQASTSGPTEDRDDQTVPGAVMAATAKGTEVVAETSAAGAPADPIVTYGNVRSIGSSTVTDAAAARARVELNDVVVAQGVLVIDSIVTELSATSDGATATSDGRTSYSGAALLGLPVTIDGTGVHFVDPPADSPLAGVGGALGSGLDPAAAALAQVLATAGGDANQVLAQAGIRVRLTEPRASVAGAGATRVSEGIVVEIEQELGATPLAALFAAIPPLPDLPGSPVGPNDFVRIVQARQVTEIALGRAEVASSAAPSFAPPALRPTIRATPAVPDAPVLVGQTPSLAGPMGVAPVVDPAGATGPGMVAIGPTRPTAAGPGLVLAPTTTAGLVALSVLGALLLTLGTRKLPDWAMAGTGAAAASCDLIDASGDASPDHGGAR